VLAKPIPALPVSRSVRVICSGSGGQGIAATTAPIISILATGQVLQDRYCEKYHTEIVDTASYACRYECFFVLKIEIYQ
jgi:hypothetical protein